MKGLKEWRMEEIKKEGMKEGGGRKEEEWKKEGMIPSQPARQTLHTISY